jgi:hypothetical protein
MQFDSGANPGTPPSAWAAGSSYYWSATTTTSGHAAVSLDGGNVIDVVDTSALNVLIQVADNVAPVFSGATSASMAESLDTSQVVYDAQAADNQGGNVTDKLLSYSLGGVDASHFSINSTNGQVKLAHGVNYEAPVDAGADNVYNITVTATDADNNATTQAVAITVTNVADTAGATSFNLGIYGNLIAPVQVEGKWYYFWDLSGNGTNTNAGSLNNGNDFVNHDFLDAIFNQDINGNVGGSGNTTETYRYATLSGLKLALPTDGLTTSTTLPATVNAPGTSASGTGATVNTTYDDLLAVWDAFNGTGTGTLTSGIPTGWLNAAYWSATPSAAGHTYVSMTGVDTAIADTAANTYVALQVL